MMHIFHVCCYILSVTVSFATDATGIWELSYVRITVSPVIVLPCKIFSTHITGVLFQWRPGQMLEQTKYKNYQLDDNSRPFMLRTVSLCVYLQTAPIIEYFWAQCTCDLWSCMMHSFCVHSYILSVTKSFMA
jgi:hypothetical protein